MWIAWNINTDDVGWPPSTLEEKVEIFYQRAYGWQLHIADLLANGGPRLDDAVSVEPLRHSGFAVMQICLSYFETIGHYEYGNTFNKSKEYFKAGLRSVFPQLIAKCSGSLDELLDRVYIGVRCGLYHNSMTVVGVGLGQPEDGTSLAYDQVSKKLAISPERLPRALKQHLQEFREKLLDPKNVSLRKNFERRFDEDNGV